MIKRADELPEIPKEEYGEVYPSTNIKVLICDKHTKEEWRDHVGYVMNLDGSISCKFCPFGSKIPGYYRVHQGKIVDLRKL